MLAVAREGLSPAAAYEYGAVRFPDAIALVDERGTLTFAEAARQVSSLSSALETAGVGGEERVGILCRNHRGFVLTTAALSSLGADIIFLNVSSSTAEIDSALSQQRATLLIHDDEFNAQLVEAGLDIRRLVTWHDSSDGPTESLEDLARGSERKPRSAWFPESRYVLLSSGTTGTPRSTARPAPLSLDPVAAMLSRIPLRVRDVTLIASPLFHAWGFGSLALAMILSSTTLLQNRFDPEATLAAIAHHRVRVLIAVPVMLQRLVELPDRTRRRYDTASLEVVATSGSTLPGDLAVKFMDSYGDVLYNVYGSTEVAWASIATPSELRAAPQTAGRSPSATKVKIVSDDGSPVADGRIGRILVRNVLASVVGGSEARRSELDGFVATGDLGHFDEFGLLFVDGREDDMIVSGGENVYPQEVEDVLCLHPAILEVAVVGVPDAEFGQRLRAVVVPRAGFDLSRADVKAYVRHRLARYKVPRDVVFVEELRRTATGKPLREGS